MLEEANLGDLGLQKEELGMGREALGISLMSHRGGSEAGLLCPELAHSS